jgi:hypothetical protein
MGVVNAIPTTKHYLPDTTACIFWLKNRRPKEWRDKVDVNAGEDSGTIRITIGGDAD